MGNVCPFPLPVDFQSPLTCLSSLVFACLAPGLNSNSWPSPRTLDENITYRLPTHQSLFESESNTHPSKFIYRSCTRSASAAPVPYALAIFPWHIFVMVVSCLYLFHSRPHRRYLCKPHHPLQAFEPRQFGSQRMCLLEIGSPPPSLGCCLYREQSQEIWFTGLFGHGLYSWNTRLLLYLSFFRLWSWQFSFEGERAALQYLALWSPPSFSTFFF